MLRVSRIVLKRLFNHKYSDIQLPKKGVVLITGDNGSGKSAIIEAVATAAWGKTVRGTQPWQAGQESYAHIETDEKLCIKRTLRDVARSPELVWWKQKQGAKQFGTTTQAQEELNPLIGDWNLWKRIDVLRGEDRGVSFTRAGDTARKQMLETVLGIHEYDSALQACRADLSAERSKFDSVERKVAVLQERLSNVLDRLEDAEEASDDEEPPEPVDEEELQQAEAKASRLQDKESAALAKLRQGSRGGAAEAHALTDAKAWLQAARREQERLDRDECPTCGQRIPADLRQARRADVREARAAVAKAQAAYDESLEAAEQERATIAEKVDKLRRRATKAEAKVHRLQEQVRRVREHERRVEATETQLDQLEAHADNAQGELERMNTKLSGVNKGLAELEATERVLGPEGVRAQLLSDALRGIEVIANRWLNRIAGKGLQLKLRSYSETKTGKIRDRISLEIDGAGGGFGFLAASPGQQRRIDVALLFALREIAAGAAGIEPGTLWVDEVADGLDLDGRIALGSTLRELGEDHTVVVITHNEELARHLRAELHLKVKDGTVSGQSWASPETRL